MFDKPPWERVPTFPSDVRALNEVPVSTSRQPPAAERKASLSAASGFLGRDPLGGEALRGASGHGGRAVQCSLEQETPSRHELQRNSLDHEALVRWHFRSSLWIEPLLIAPCSRGDDDPRKTCSPRNCESDFSWRKDHC